MSYTYNPANIQAYNKDRMRFELGDTMVDGGAATCALSDEEYLAVLMLHKGKWRKAKLALIESILRRFSYEVDTKIGPLSLSLRQRVEDWQKLYEEVKAEASAASVPCPSNPNAIESYFYTGIHDNVSGRNGRGDDTHVP